MPKRGDAKYGSAGVQDQQTAQRIRRQRVETLAEDAFDVKESPYYTKGVGGQIECRLCHTVQRSTAHFILHLQGRQHRLRELTYKQHRERRDKRKLEVEAILARRFDSSLGSSAAQVGADDPTTLPAVFGRPDYAVELAGDAARPIIIIKATFAIPQNTPELLSVAGRDATPCHRFVAAAELGPQADRRKSYVVIGTSAARAPAAYLEGAQLKLLSGDGPGREGGELPPTGALLWTPIAVEIPNLPVVSDTGQFVVEWVESTRTYFLYIPLLLPQS